MAVERVWLAGCRAVYMGGDITLVGVFPGRFDFAAQVGADRLPPGGRGAHDVLPGGFPDGFLLLGGVQRVALLVPDGGGAAGGAHAALVVGGRVHLTRHLDAGDRAAAAIADGLGDVESVSPE